MSTIEKLRIGIVGAAGRPTSFLSAIRDSEKAILTSACDLNQEALEEAFKGIDGITKYEVYEEMLEKENLDAVIIGTPMPLHVSQSIAALKKDIHVLSEVTAAVTIDECRDLFEACKNSRAQYMMGENCNYMKPYMTVREMIRNGIFGEIFYAEGEYLHDCRELLDKTPWRRKYLYETRGITYGTHSLGPILSWMEGDSIDSVCCIGTGNHNLDLSEMPIGGDDTAVMLCKTKQNRLIKIRTDLSSPRPYSLNYTLQGTAASYEGFHLGEKGEFNQVYIARDSSKEQWDDISKYEEKYLPKLWRDSNKKVEGSGHGGSDAIMMTDFIEAIYYGRSVPIDIYASLEMTLPGLVSQESILQGGAWLPVPDPRKW